MSYTRRALHFEALTDYDEEIGEQRCTGEWQLQLDHSCREWEIGTKAEAKMFAADLATALANWPTGKPDTFKEGFLVPYQREIDGRTPR